MVQLLLFFVLAFATIAALLWCGFELFRDREDPLSDRLEALQAHAMATSTTKTRRRGGGFVNNILYVISQIPGGEDWLEDAEDELGQAGFSRKALAVYTVFQILFLIFMVSAMWWIQIGASTSSKFIGVVAALLLELPAPAAGAALLSQTLPAETSRRFTRHGGPSRNRAWHRPVSRSSHVARQRGDAIHLS